jgi:hypothetical protein
MARTQAQWRARMEALASGQASMAEVRALELLGRSHGWDAPAKRKASPRPLPADPIERIMLQLADVRVNRATAERDSSHVAARGYLADELQLSAQLDAAIEAKRKEDEARRDEVAIVAAFREDLRRLPLSVQRRIREVVLAEVGDDA